MWQEIAKFALEFFKWLLNRLGIQKDEDELPPSDVARARRIRRILAENPYGIPIRDLAEQLHENDKAIREILIRIVEAKKVCEVPEKWALSNSTKPTPRPVPIIMVVLALIAAGFTAWQLYARSCAAICNSNTFEGIIKCAQCERGS